MATRRKVAASLMGLPLAAPAALTTSVPVPPLSETAVRIISYTIYAESRGEPFKGKVAVAAVIHTRSKLLKTPLHEICLQPKQFSCWNEIKGVPEHYATGARLNPHDIKARTECYGLAWILIAGTQKWEHLTHFYNPSKVIPEWAGALNDSRMIGNHVFGHMKL